MEEESQKKNVESELTGKIIAAAIEVHRELGPGLLELCYESCLTFELIESGLQVQRQVELPVRYKERTIDCGYRIDLLVEKKVMVEVKSVESLSNVHEAQLLTYLRLSGHRVGVLMNFNEKVLRNGIKRRVL